MSAAACSRPGAPSQQQRRRLCGRTRRRRRKLLALALLAACAACASAAGPLDRGQLLLQEDHQHAGPRQLQRDRPALAGLQDHAQALDHGSASWQPGQRRGRKGALTPGGESAGRESVSAEARVSPGGGDAPDPVSQDPHPLHAAARQGPAAAVPPVPPAQREAPARSLRGLSSRARSRLAYVLLGSGTRDDLLAAALKQLRDHLLPWTPGDVLFYHTGEYDSPARQQLVTRVLPQALVQRIPATEWSLPEGLKEEDAPGWKYSPCCPFPMHGIGYRHMCRWYSNGLFRHLASLGYKWVFRLDEDSEVYSDVRVNMVGWMEAHGKQYGFRLWDVEDADMVWSLPELTAWYLTAKEIRPKWLYDACRPRASSGLNSHGGWNRRIVYNNMFMANVTWWLTPEVQSYLAAVEQSRGHYLYRWGDAPIHTMVVRTFLTRQQVHVFGFAYCHKGNCDAQRLDWTPALRDTPP